MNKQNSRHDTAAQKNVRGENSTLGFCVRLGLTAALCGTSALFLSDTPNAQQRYKEPTVHVTDVKTSGNTVSISADGSLSRAQTWQDPEGFHVVLVNGQADAASTRGVKVRRVGNSVELVVPVKPGANVTVEPRGDRLDLVVSGGSVGALNVENFPVESRQESSRRERSGEQSSESNEQASRRAESRAQQSSSKRRGPSEATAAEVSQPSSQPVSTSSQSASTSPQPASQAAPQQSAPQPQTNEQAPSDVVNMSSQPQSATQPQSAADLANEPVAAQLKTGEGFDFFSLLFSLPALFVLLGVGLAGAALFVVRRRNASADDEETVGRKKSKAAARVADESGRVAEESNQTFQTPKGDRRRDSIAVPFERRASGFGAEDEALRRLITPGAEGAGRNGEQPERAVESSRSSVAAQAVQFGAYRINEEVSRLVQGLPHSVEVLSSRATDDRRAVETSLLKALRAPETDEDGRRRTRMALEDYGFVARSCAHLLLGSESFERASSARTLGEMKSAQALPFLTEALYDADSVVRMECVQSLAALGMPSAIGALLDAARRHPEIPASVLGPALTACSVESLELDWDSQTASRTFAGSDNGEEFAGDEREFGSAQKYEELPDWIEDETLQIMLERLESADVESRVHSAQQLAQFQVRRSVEALAAMSQHDAESTVRSAAVTSLGLINHESVFAPVIVALADDAREVRAAAARALSRLSFDRADAYVRVIESADETVLRGVARACVKAGLASQAFSRLASEDRRQAYESFSLLSLCAKAGEVQPILDTVECHRDIEVRMACVSLLALSYEPELSERLLRIAENGGVPERVRRAILETVGRAAKPQPVAAE